MARRRIDAPPAAALRACADDKGRLALRVTPGARTDSIEIAEGGVLVKTRARPEGGKANQAVIAQLADALGLPKSHLDLLRGATSREKLVQLPEE